MIDLVRDGFVRELIPFMEGINGRIDQTMLKYDKSLKDYEVFVEESDGYGFRSLVVPSVMVGYIASIAKTPVAGVVGFPYGYIPAKVKEYEIGRVADSGGKEVDVVINIINVKSGNYGGVVEEIESLVRSAKERGLVIKVILETSVLTDEELIKTTEIAVNAGVDFVKTNSGYGPRGATLRDVYLMRSVTEGTGVRVKAAGGIRTALDAASFIKAGADVIGASSGIKIVREANKYLKEYRVRET